MNKATIKVRAQSPEQAVRNAAQILGDFAGVDTVLHEGAFASDRGYRVVNVSIAYDEVTTGLAAGDGLEVTVEFAFCDESEMTTLRTKALA